MGLATIELRSARFDWSRVYVAGVLNVTPDSFSDGGVFLDLSTAVAHARALVQAGADLIDVGGESTRPGATPVDESTERARVLPVVRALVRALPVPVSVDTTKARMARAALDAGAEIINDISGGRFDADVPAVVGDAGAVYICGHVRGNNVREAHAAENEPPGYDEVVADLAERVAAMPAALRHRVVVDPGLGFGKRMPQNLELLRRAGELGARLGCPVMVGPSRKRFIAELIGDQVRDMSLRDRGTVGACLAAAAGGAQLVRTHDVALVVPALRVFEAAWRQGGAA